MQGELPSSHMFIDGGSDSEDEKPATGAALPGADFSADPTSGRYQLAHIYPGDPAGRCG